MHVIRAFSQQYTISIHKSNTRKWREKFVSFNLNWKLVLASLPLKYIEIINITCVIKCERAAQHVYVYANAEHMTERKFICVLSILTFKINLPRWSQIYLIIIIHWHTSTTIEIACWVRSANTQAVVCFINAKSEAGSMPQYRHSCPVTTRFIWMCGFPRIDRTMRGTGHELTILCVARQRAIGLRKAGSNASHHTICIYHGEPHIILFRLWRYEYLCDRRSFA